MTAGARSRTVRIYVTMFDYPDKAGTVQCSRCPFSNKEKTYHFQSSTTQYSLCSSHNISSIPLQIPHDTSPRYLWEHLLYPFDICLSCADIACGIRVATLRPRTCRGEEEEADGQTTEQQYEDQLWEIYRLVGHFVRVMNEASGDGIEAFFNVKLITMDVGWQARWWTPPPDRERRLQRSILYLSSEMRTARCH